MIKITSDQLAALKRFKPVMEGFSAVLVSLDDNATLESLQQAYNETEARLNDKREEEKTLDGRIKAVADNEAALEELKKKAADKAEQIIAEARTEADRIKAEGQKDAEYLLNNAKDARLAAKRAAQTELNEISAQAEQKRTEFTELADATDAKKKELDKHIADLVAAQEHLGKLLKG